MTATIVLPESGSEIDDEVSNVPPETLVFHDDDGMINGCVCVCVLTLLKIKLRV